MQSLVQRVLKIGREGGSLPLLGIKCLSEKTWYRKVSSSLLFNLVKQSLNLTSSLPGSKKVHANIFGSQDFSLLSFDDGFRIWSCKFKGVI